MKRAKKHLGCLPHAADVTLGPPWFSHLRAPRQRRFPRTHRRPDTLPRLARRRPDTLPRLARRRLPRLRLRRVLGPSTGPSFSVRPSFVLPYQAALAEAVEGPLFLRTFGVPSGAIARFLRHGALVLALLALPAAARGDDWPQWLGPHRDSVWRESGILEKFPPGGPKVLWRAPVAGGYTGPAVADGRVYVMDRVVPPGVKDPTEGFVRRKEPIPGTERVLCFSAADGKLLWKHEYDCPYYLGYPLGPRCTPLVAGGKVYTLGAEGHLFCLDAASGKVQWSHDLVKEYQAKAPIWGYAAHPLLDGQKLICMVGGEGSTAVAFDKDTGKELWRALSTKELGYCPPTIVDVGGKRQLIIWHGEAANGLDPETGKVYWTEPFASYSGMAISTPRLMGELLNAIKLSGSPLWGQGLR
jgi:hypothetical protein